jgi:hypothetical protein
MKRSRKPKVGSSYKAWFTGDRPDGSSTILKVEKYRGKYTAFFTWDLTLAAPDTRKGSVVMSVL